jgi:putative transposase
MEETIKTLEFKLYPNQQQTQLINHWLDQGRHIWNKGLEILEEIQQRKWREKSGLNPDDGKEVWEWYVNVWDKKERGEDSPWVNEKKQSTDRILALSCPITHYGTQKRFNLDSPVYVVPLRQAQGLDYSKNIKSLIYGATTKESEGMCTRFKSGIIADLMDSWKAYQDPKRGMMRKPKYKGKRFPLESLTNEQPSTIKVKDSKIKLPIIGLIRFKGVDRIPSEADIRVARICKKATGFYLQLAIKYYWQPVKIKHPDQSIGVDPGVVFATTLSTGRQKESVAVHDSFLAREAKIKRLQRKLSRQKQGGTNWQKTKLLIGILHEKQARQRNEFWHKESSYLIGNFGAIAIEDNSHANMRRRCKPQLRADGTGYLPNGQKAKSGLNRSLSKVAAGKLKEMVKAKALTSGNEVSLVASHYNSQTCSNCGCTDKNNRLSQSLFICVVCGYNINADVNAAINVERRADWLKDFVLSTPVSLGEFKPLKDGSDGSQRPSMQEEDSLAISPEITGRSAPKGELLAKQSEKIAIIPKAAMGKAKRQSLKKQDCQTAKSHIQLNLWD